MKAFDELTKLADTLLGEGGCPWDKKQTFASLQPYLLEECHEALEAVDEGDPEKMREELGDLLYVIVFYCKIAEKKGTFTTEELLTHVKNKLIRRHPHVFGDVKARTAQEVLIHWEKVKSQEKEIKARKSALEGIPKTLKGLTRAQKIIHKIKRKKDVFLSHFMFKKEREFDETLLGNELIQLIYHADEMEIDVEGALRRSLKKYEEAFTTWEKSLLD